MHHRRKHHNNNNNNTAAISTTPATTPVTHNLNTSSSSSPPSTTHTTTTTKPTSTTRTSFLVPSILNIMSPKTNKNHHHHHKQNASSPSSSSSPNMAVTGTMAALYVLSGCSQPLIMTLCKAAGLADSSTQLYMMFYYLGPASVMIPLLLFQNNNNNSTSEPWPSRPTIAKACGIALWDIVSSSMNYTGAGLAGPTIFAIVYSSVTIWTAVFSQVFLGRIMNRYQWLAVFVVFGGLTLTTTDSLQMGQDVVTGLLLVLLGSIMHALTYVMSEGIMTVGQEQLSVKQNCAVQGVVAFTSFLLWQLVYTVPRWDNKIKIPMQRAETSVGSALMILCSFSVANLIHALTFFHTLRHYPGGATSAGVMKGLQAVLVFVLTHFIYCGRMGGQEMCFTQGKLLALITVSSGVVAYGVATQERGRSGRSADYEQIPNAVDGIVEIEPFTETTTTKTTAPSSTATAGGDGRVHV